MSKRPVALVSLLLIMVFVATGCGLLQETAAPSAEIEAVPLAVATEVVAEANEAVAELPTPEVIAATAETIEPTAESAEPTAETVAPTAEVVEAAAGTLTVFTIDQGASSVRFELNEELRGQPTTVVGVTDQVAGELALNPSDLSQTQIGTLQINARTLLTDNNFRNRAIQNEILDTGGFEFITFVPTSIDGMPASASVGDTVEFTITGDLTIRDITAPATFTVQATMVSDSQVTGSASTVITRAAYDLRIPSVPSVANVEEEVELYIDFTANAS